MLNISFNLMSSHKFYFSLYAIGMHYLHYPRKMVLYCKGKMWIHAYACSQSFPATCVESIYCFLTGIWSAQVPENSPNQVRAGDIYISFTSEICSELTILSLELQKKWLQDAFVLNLLQAQEVESWLFETTGLQVMSSCS